MWEGSGSMYLNNVAQIANLSLSSFCWKSWIIPPPFSPIQMKIFFMKLLIKWVPDTTEALMFFYTSVGFYLVNKLV